MQFPSILLIPLAFLCSTLTYHSSSTQIVMQGDYAGSFSLELLAHVRPRRSIVGSLFSFGSGLPPPPTPMCADRCCGHSQVCDHHGCDVKPRCGLDCCPPHVVQNERLEARRLTLAAAGLVPEGPPAPRPLTARPQPPPPPPRPRPPDNTIGDDIPNDFSIQNIFIHSNNKNDNFNTIDNNFKLNPNNFNSNNNGNQNGNSIDHSPNPAINFNSINENFNQYGNVNIISNNFNQNSNNLTPNPNSNNLNPYSNSPILNHNSNNFNAKFDNNIIHNYVPDQPINNWNNGNGRMRSIPNGAENRTYLPPQQHMNQINVHQLQGWTQQGGRNGHEKQNSGRWRDLPPPIMSSLFYPPPSHPPPPHSDHRQGQGGRMHPHPHANGPKGRAPSQGAFGPSTRGGFSAAVSERRMAAQKSNNGMQSVPQRRLTFSTFEYNRHPPPGREMGPERPPAFSVGPPSIDSPVIRPAAFGAHARGLNKMPSNKRIKRCCERCMPDCNQGCIRNGGCASC